MANRLWSYATGVKGINRIRVYERRPGGPLYVEWYDRLGRHQKTLTTLTGVPVTDKTLARKIADSMAAAQAKKRNQQTARSLLHLPEEHTLGELLDEYHAVHEEDGSWVRRYANNQKVNRRFWLNRLGADTELTTINPAKVKEVILAELRERTTEEFTPSMQKARLRYLKEAFNYARDIRKWITHEQDLKAVKLPKVQGRSRPYSKQEAQRILKVAPEVDLRCGVLCHLAVVSGRRLTAMLSLPASAYSTVEKDGKEFGCIQFAGVTDKARRSGEVYVYGRAKALIEELLATKASQTGGMLFPGGRGLDTASRPGETASDTATRLWLTEAEKRAGVESIKGRGYHGFKRRFATEALRVDEQAASKQSGTNVEMLRGSYAQDDVEPKMMLAEHMDDLMENTDA